MRTYGTPQPSATPPRPATSPTTATTHRCAQRPSPGVAVRHLCGPVGTLPTGPQVCSCMQERSEIRFSGYGRISLTSPHRNLPSWHAGHSLSLRPDKPPSLILLVRPDSQFRAAFEFDHKIPGSSHLSLSNHVTGQSDEMGGRNVREFWIERHMIPGRDLKNRLGLDAQFTISTGQDCESRVEADTGNYLTLKVQVHSYHPTGSG